MSTKKKDMDMLNGSLWDKILAYALPLAATGVLQQLFNAADVAVVGRFTGDLGPAAMAAVGANSPVIGLIVNVFVGVSLGTNVVIANAVGKQDQDTIRKAVHTSIVFAVLGGIVLAVVGETDCRSAAVCPERTGGCAADGCPVSSDLRGRAAGDSALYFTAAIYRGLAIRGCRLRLLPYPALLMFS